MSIVIQARLYTHVYTSDKQRTMLSATKQRHNMKFTNLQFTILIT